MTLLDHANYLHRSSRQAGHYGLLARAGRQFGPWVGVRVPDEVEEGHWAAGPLVKSATSTDSEASGTAAIGSARCSPWRGRRRSL